MDMRAEVWSPLQNTAVWLGSWLWGHETTDDLLDALKELGGRPESVDEAPFVDVLAMLRAETAELTAKRGERAEPVVRLALSGPGEPPCPTRRIGVLSRSYPKFRRSNHSSHQ